MEERNTICATCLFPLTATYPAAIKRLHTSSPSPIYPPLQNSTPTLHSPSSTSGCFFIYLCYLAPPLTLTLFIFYSTMVSATCAKNKTSHPAAPVMTEAAQKKAGIKTKRRPKKVTKDQTIRELNARIAALENPDEESFSKDPLVHTTQLPGCHMCTRTLTTLSF